MKTDPEAPQLDLCQTSIDILKVRCRELLSGALDLPQLVFLDDYDAFSAAINPDRVTDLVFFGGFVERFLESGNWPVKEARLWVISSASRDALESLLGIPRQNIGLIPRNKIFTVSGAAPPIPGGAGQRATWVFAGRISPTKNIELLVRTVHVLQRDWGRNIELQLIGDFDDQPHPDRGRRDGADHRAQIESLVRALEWKVSPKIRPKMAADEWFRQKFENPVLVNLSTFICEDFDVSLAQAQAAGWPAIVSNWGGHRDAREPGTLKIPPALIGHSHLSSEVLGLHAEALAAHLAHALEQDLTEGMSGRPYDNDELEIPSLIRREQIDAARQSFILKYHPTIQRVHRHGLVAFADSSQGRAFFSAYRAIFSGGPSRPFDLIFVNDLAPGGPDVGRTTTIFRKFLRESRSAGRDLVTMQYREWSEPSSLFLLARAQRIVFSFEAEGSQELMRFLLQDLGVSAESIVRPDVGMAGELR